MKYQRILRKDFFITLFIKQNKHHRFGVLLHTFAVLYHILKHKNYKMLMAGLLHDIGKPIIAYQDEKDIHTGEYSFHNHEEISYHMIKHWPISSYTKNLVRYHYLLRGRMLSEKRGQTQKYNRMNRIYTKLDESFKEDLKEFLYYDDCAK